MTSLPVHPLGSLAAPLPGAITDGPFGSNLTSAHYTDDGPLVVRLQNIGDGVYKHAAAHISNEHFQSLRKHEVLAGDLLVASLGESLPRACLAPDDLGPAIVKADCIRIRLGDDVEPRWVMYALQRPEARRWAESRLHGVGRPRLGLKLIREIPIPVAPIAEQRRIVDILEDHLSRLDAGTDAISTTIQRLRSLRVSTLSKAREMLIDEAAPALPIGDVASTRLGKMLDSKRASGFPTPYLRNINVRWGHVDLSTVQEVPLSEGERTEFALKEGDLLVCEGGEPGRCAVWPGSKDLMTYQKALHRVRPDRARLEPNFLALMLEEEITSGRASRHFTGTTIKHLPQERLRQIIVPIPSLERQNAVVRRIEASDDAATALRHELHMAERRSQSLRRALLSAAFSGHLTGRSSDAGVVDEIASTKRVLVP